MPLLLSKNARLTKLKIATFAASLVIVSLTGCATQKTASVADSSASTSTQVIKPTELENLFGFITPYRITIQQGNFVSQEMAGQLKEGMTREQVRFIFGTALLTDMFHEDRWDYPFRLQKPNGEVITSRLAIFFKNNTVERFERGQLPTEKEYLAHITTAAIAVRNQSELTEAPKKK